MPLPELAAVLADASAVVAVDTGLAHLAGALGVPTVTLYGATDPGLTGVMGSRTLNLGADFECAPCLRRRCFYPGRAQFTPACYTSLRPEHVWGRLQSLIGVEHDRVGGAWQ